MRTTVYKIPGVRFIGWVEAEKLIPDIALRGIAMMTVPVLTEIHEISFVDEPQCECVTEIEGTSSSCTAKLTFLTAELLPQGRHLAFVVTAMDGNSYIIGAREVPFTKVKFTINLGEKASQRSCNSYEVTHSAIRTLVKCQI